MAPARGASGRSLKVSRWSGQDFGIRVNAIEPGWFRTELTEPLFQNPEWVAKVENRVPMGRAGRPEELGGTIAFLASPLSDYITGAMIRVDGGALAA